MNQNTIEIVVEERGDGLRATYIPNGFSSMSWVGETVTSDQDLALQVATEFARWWGSFGVYGTEKGAKA